VNQINGQVPISSTFFARFFHPYFGAKNYKAAQSCAKRFRMKFYNKNVLSYKKCVRKMLKKLTTACVSLIYEVNCQKKENKEKVSLHVKATYQIRVCQLSLLLP